MKCSIIILEKIYKNILIMLFFMASNNFYAQTIAPQVAGFPSICAGVGFNSYPVTFVYSGFPVATTFIVELSDPTGSFTTPIIPTIISTTDNTATQKTIRFAIPSNLVGSDKYKIRIKSSTGVNSSPLVVNTGTPTTSISVYYKPFENAFYINNQIETATICLGGSTTLSVDNPTPNIENSSPVNYPSIKYKWFKDGVPIPGQSASSITVNSLGVYYAVLDYGLCTDANFSSIRVTVSNGSTSTGVVSSSQGNPFCFDGNNPTVLSNEQTGLSYQWYKNDVLIAGQTNKEISTSVPGKYTVITDFGGCISTSVIDLKVVNVTSSLNVTATSSLVNGEPKPIIVTSSDTNVTYEWYQNDVLIPNETANTYIVSQKGNYKVVIKHIIGCINESEISFSIIDYSDIKEIPNIISPNNDGSNDTWELPEKYLSGSNTQVTLISSQGEVVLETTNYSNDFPTNEIVFGSVNPVYYYIITTQNQEVKKGSVTIIK